MAEIKKVYKNGTAYDVLNSDTVGSALTAGTGIGISSNTISNTGVTSVNNQTGAVTVNEVPSGGTDGQVLSKVSGSVAWANPAATGITNETTGTTSTVTKIWAGTTSEYNSLGSKNATTIYFTF